MKVKEVLKRIGDGPLIETLKERGYITYPGLKASEHVITEAKEMGYIVIDQSVVETGYEMYRAKKVKEFNNWLREQFWKQLGRIA